MIDGMEKLVQSGIISIKFNDDKQERIYESDTRGLYLKSAYDYLKSNSKSSAIELGNQIKISKSLNEIIKILNSYQIVNETEFIIHIRNKVKDLLEAEKDIKEIDKL